MLKENNSKPELYTHKKRSFKQFFFSQYIKALHLPENKLKRNTKGESSRAFVVYVQKCRKEGERVGKYARNTDYKKIIIKIIVIRVSIV